MRVIAPAWPALQFVYQPVFETPVIFSQQQAERALDDISAGLIIIYKQEIAIVGAVDTRFFIDTVRIRSARQGVRMVASDAPYSGVVEHGWIYRARGQGSYPGRWPAARAIASLDRVIDTAFSHQLVR